MTTRQTLGNKTGKFDRLQNQVRQLEMSTRINQMVLKQVGTAMDKMTAELRHVEGEMGDLRYRLTAYQNITNVDKDLLQEETDRLKLIDFNTASGKEDSDKSLLVVDTVESQDDIVIITSKTPKETEERGFLRSKIQLKAMNQPVLQASLMGKTVGDKVTADLNGTEHEIELLGVRRIPTPPASLTDSSEGSLDQVKLSVVPESVESTSSN